MPDRIAITGMGAVTAVGVGADALWDAAREGRSGVKALKFPEHERLRVKIAAHLFDIDIAKYHERGNPLLLDRFSALALIAANEACKQAGIVPGAAGERCGVIIGSGIGGISAIEEGVRQYYMDCGRENPMLVPRVMTNAAASQVSIKYGAKGPSFCVSSACSSGAQSIGLGMSLIRAGMIDCAIVGGAEALISPATLRSWELLRVLSPTACRPFSAKRDGMVLGEGAAVLVIETERSAQRRGAPCIAELAGYGSTSDAGDILRPDPEGARRSIEMAIADAGLDATEIGYVNAHGTGTVLNDVSEAKALKVVFGAALNRTAVSSTKPIHGHALGAAGSIELVVALRSLLDQIAPPTINWLGPDPAYELDPVPHRARPIETDAVLSNSFAFGGINASLVVRRWS